MFLPTSPTTVKVSLNDSMKPFDTSVTPLNSPNISLSDLNIPTAEPASISLKKVLKSIVPITFQMLSTIGFKNSTIPLNPPAIALKNDEKSKFIIFPSALIIPFDIDVMKSAI